MVSFFGFFATPIPVMYCSPPGAGAVGDNFHTRPSVSAQALSGLFLDIRNPSRLANGGFFAAMYVLIVALEKHFVVRSRAAPMLLAAFSELWVILLCLVDSLEDGHA
mmetsp:Transcript_32965/g.81636  ORF Transcript_32965/g.81636 Transcript_32965/m.81636 type:complete len:107 (-) Transcript_32965:16-336(-)